MALGKYLPPLSENEKAMILKLAHLRLDSYTEADIREEYLAPIIALLGYRRDSDYQVLREDTFKLSPLFVMFGRQRYDLDYRFVIWKQGFWLLEAKPGQCADPATPPVLTDEDVGQAFSYALHPSIDAPYFAISNGWQTQLYDRDGSTTEPILSFAQGELPDKFEELRRLLHARQITFQLKRRLLARVEQVLSADVDLDRLSEFQRMVADVVQRSRPKVSKIFAKTLGFKKPRETIFSGNILSRHAPLRSSTRS
jgi:hypothetical protein